MEYHVPSVALAMRILKLLSRYKYKSCSLKDISDLLHSNTTTCMRVLRTLAREDFITFDPETKKYSLGPYLIPLGNRAMELNDFMALAISELKSVAHLTGVTTVLIERLQDDHLIYIGSEEPPREEVKISVSIGQQFPIGAVAFGRCFLAYDDEEQWQRFIQAEIVRSTQNSAGGLDALIGKLKQIKAQGYAVSHGELTPGISSFAAPIFNKIGHVEVVLACLAMTTQLHSEQEHHIIEVLLEKTQELSEWNGYQHKQSNTPVFD